jgi:hypothetical protein
MRARLAERVTLPEAPPKDQDKPSTNSEDRV